ncbi:MAG: AAA family ATPase, partial [Bacteroidota bacterium]
MKDLPLDIQSIETILKDGRYVYVDKTAFAHQLITGGVSNFFLSRPRRFGKSLFVSTLEEIFKGNKELFKDCAIYQTDYDWQPYPVAMINLYEIDTRSAYALEESIKRYLQTVANHWEVKIETPTAAEGLKSLILALYQKYQQQPVVLIDEYDRPILRNIQDQAEIGQVRGILEDFFGMLKSMSRHLRFTFVTGTSKFSKVSLFTVANILKDITMNPKYAAIMGYTEEELKTYFAEHIQLVAQHRGCTKEEILTEVKEWYNGYRFSKAETYVYNPFSTLNYMDEQEPQSYWYTTSTPTFLIKEIQKRPATAMSLAPVSASENQLTDARTIEDIELSTLMFQTGYLTIQHW